MGVKKILRSIYHSGKNSVNRLEICHKYNVMMQPDIQNSKLMDIPPLSKEDIQSIDDYWGKFGVKFRDYSSFKVFYGVTGKKDPRFIPVPFACYVIYPYYNDQTKRKAYADKNMFQKIMPSMNFPEMLGQRINKRFYDRDGHYYGEKPTIELSNTLFTYISERSDHNIVVKEALDSSFGLGVKKYEINDSGSLDGILRNNCSENYIIQRAIRQHQFFRQFNESSVNIIRLTTWRCGENVYVFSPCVRFGIPGSSTDVSFVNGIEILNCVGIDESGRLYDKGVHLDGKSFDVNVAEKKVPCWEKIVELVKRNHLKMNYFDIIAWDITIDEESNIICIEYNLNQPGVLIYQFAHGPLAGEHTDELLGFLKDEKNQRKYLPKSIRK